MAPGAEKDISPGEMRTMGPEKSLCPLSLLIRRCRLTIFLMSFRKDFGVPTTAERPKFPSVRELGEEWSWVPPQREAVDVVRDDVESKEERKDNLNKHDAIVRVGWLSPRRFLTGF